MYIKKKFLEYCWEMIKPSSLQREGQHRQYTSLPLFFYNSFTEILENSPCERIQFNICFRGKCLEKVYPSRPISQTFVVPKKLCIYQLSHPIPSFTFSFHFTLEEKAKKVLSSHFFLKQKNYLRSVSVLGHFNTHTEYH